MQVLHELIHAMAKEEKRLYSLHGRNSRFMQIYKGYLEAPAYDKGLDRELYRKHFSSFSKAFYSMQKNDLLDDILAVLLEYSNSSQDDFSIHRHRGKYEVLIYKGFHDQALSYIRAALESADKLGKPRVTLRILEDLRDTLSRSTSATWKEFSDTVSRIEELQSSLQSNKALEPLQMQLNILINSHLHKSDDEVNLQSLAHETVSRIRDVAGEYPTSESKAAAFWSEYQYSKAFEDSDQLHRRLIALEKQAVKESYPKDVRLQAVNLLLESALECGDFLLINGLIYKTQRELEGLTPRQRREFLPKFLELSSIYHFYENDLPLALREISELIRMEDHPTEDLMRYYFHKIYIQVAATIPRGASETILEMTERIPRTDQDPQVHLAQLIVAVGHNQREEALVLLQKFRTLLRKRPDGRKFSHYRLFLDMLQRFLNKKQVPSQEIHTLETEWRDLLKLDLWMKSRQDNSFYYNSILDYWQGRKKILNF
ncbi:MAG: hypothetical protein RLZZ165_187 [Bacteroidota bacterium]|jgi:hypothetical protein